MLIVGFGAVGQGSLPLILRHIDMRPEQLTIVTADESGRNIAAEYGIKFRVEPLTAANYIAILRRELGRGDFLVNAAFDVSSTAVLEWCQQNGVLYIDACLEPWRGGHSDLTVPASRRSNYAHREAALALRGKYPSGPTGILMHGANPGLVSHLVKEALLTLAADVGMKPAPPRTRADWAGLAMRLNVKVIHVAERDHQTTRARKRNDEFVNTWSSEAFCGESLQPAELGWGTHERHWPRDGREYNFGCGAAIYLDRAGVATQVRSWAPFEGSFHGWLISHGEAISIPDYLTVRDGGKVLYRPTCHYAYHPCDDAVLSLHEFSGNGWRFPPKQRLLREEIDAGFDELGVLLMGHKKGAYWYGSQLSIGEARKLCPHNNATSLQVNAPFVAAIIWALQNPRAGIREPDEIDFQAILEITKPYLGELVGAYTDWTPLVGRSKLYPEEIDASDPWQFMNFRVT
ncbi:MAG: homospermidine synthase [Betaproteobacteria bacterium]|nr:homospermidine synthase [Betaproteobacteria bacterium]